MKKYPLIGVSIVAVVVLILASLSNVVGFQTVQSSNQKEINTKADQKELLFQTIVDIANNKEIQRIILKSQIASGKFFDSDEKFPAFNTPILTKNALKQMYLIGLMLSKVISKSRMHSIVEQYQLNNQEMQKETNAVVENDVTLKGEMTQLSNQKCDCENENTTQWSYPVVCMLLFPLVIALIAITIMSHQVIPFIEIMMNIGLKLHCFWYLGP
jgi:hypothetical protein